MVASHVDTYITGAPENVYGMRKGVQLLDVPETRKPVSAVVVSPPDVTLPLHDVQRVLGSGVAIERISSEQAFARGVIVNPAGKGRLLTELGRVERLPGAAAFYLGVARDSGLLVVYLGFKAVKVAAGFHIRSKKPIVVPTTLDECEATASGMRAARLRPRRRFPTWGEVITRVFGQPEPLAAVLAQAVPAWLHAYPAPMTSALVIGPNAAPLLRASASASASAAHLSMGVVSGLHGFLFRGAQARL